MLQSLIFCCPHNHNIFTFTEVAILRCGDDPDTVDLCARRRCGAGRGASGPDGDVQDVEQQQRPPRMEKTQVLKNTFDC